MFVPIIAAALASSGLWSLIMFAIRKKDEKSPENKMLRGLAHDRICFLAEQYIERGYVTRDEFENLHDYLYLPYLELGGNGTAKRLMDAVSQLPVRRKDDE